MITTNPIQLRKDVDTLRNMIQTKEHLQTTDAMYDLIRAIRFSIQIIQNHKIVNYKDGYEDYIAVENAETFVEMWNIVDVSYRTLKSLTDGVIKQEILKKANAKRV